MVLNLSDQQRLALMELLQSQIEKIGPRIRHTEDASFKALLRQQRFLLSEVLRRLQVRPVMA